MGKMGKISCLGIPAALFLLADFSIVDSVECERDAKKRGKPTQGISPSREESLDGDETEVLIDAGLHQTEGRRRRIKAPRWRWLQSNAWGLGFFLFLLFGTLFVVIHTEVTKKPSVSPMSIPSNTSNANFSIFPMSKKQWNEEMRRLCEGVAFTTTDPGASSGTTSWERLSKGVAFTTTDPGTVTTAASSGTTSSERLSGGSTEERPMESLISAAQVALLDGLLKERAESEAAFDGKYEKFQETIYNLAPNICDVAPGTERDNLQSLVSAAIVGKTLDKSIQDWLRDGDEALEKRLGSKQGTPEWYWGRSFIPEQINRILSKQYPNEKVPSAAWLQRRLKGAPQKPRCVCVPDAKKDD